MGYYCRILTTGVDPGYPQHALLLLVRGLVHSDAHRIYGYVYLLQCLVYHLWLAGGQAVKSSFIALRAIVGYTVYLRPIDSLK